MPYADKDKQRSYQRQWVRNRLRDSSVFAAKKLQQKRTWWKLKGPHDERCLICMQYRRTAFSSTCGSTLCDEIMEFARTHSYAHRGKPRYRILLGIHYTRRYLEWLARQQNH